MFLEECNVPLIDHTYRIKDYTEICMIVYFAVSLVGVILSTRYG